MFSRMASQRMETSDSSGEKMMDLRCEPFFTDISPNRNGAIYKRIVSPGEGDEKPQIGDRVYIQYTQKQSTPDYDWLAPFTEGQKFEFGLKIDSVIKVLELGVATMKKGEKSIFLCHPLLALGKGQQFDTSPDEPAIFDVELISWKELPLVSDDGILEERNQKKIRVYNEMILRLQSNWDLDDDQGDKNALILSGYHKIANRYLVIEKYERALEYCTKIFQCYDQGYRGLLKTAQAFMGLRNFDAAKEYFTQVLEIIPDEKEPQDYIFACNEITLYNERVENNPEERRNALNRICMNIAEKYADLGDRIDAAHLISNYLSKEEACLFSASEEYHRLMSS